MKKIWLVLMLMLSFATKVYAIEDYYIEATIENNGDLVVEKYINLDSDEKEFTEVVQYKDYYSRKVNNDLKYYWVNSNNDADNVSLETVLAVDVNDYFNFGIVNGDNLQYVEEKDLGKKLYTVDLTGYNNQAIYIKYRITGLGVLNLDTGELFFRLFTDDFKDKEIENFKLTINVPNNIKELKYWGNEINNSSIYNIGMTKLIANVSNLKIEDNIDLRMIFDTDVISNSSNKSYRDVRDRIIKYEDYAVDRQQREVMDVYNRCSITILNQFCEIELNLLLRDLPDSQFKSEIVDSLDELKETMEENNDKTILQEAFADDRLLDLPPEYEKEFRNVRLVYYGGILVAILLILYLNYFSKNRYRSLNKYEYLRDFPSDIKPSAVTYLMKGKITSKALSADILDLIHRKVIVATKDVNDAKNYILTINSENYDTCSDDDRLLIKMLFAGKDIVTMKDIKKDALYNKDSFRQRCFNYVYCLMCKYRQLGYFDLKLMAKINSMGSWVFTTSLIVTIFHFSFLLLKMVFHPLEPSWAHYPMATYTLLIPMIFTGCVVFLLDMMKRIIIRTRYGQEEYYKWQAFQNFLTSFGLMDEKKVLEVVLWEKYLVYATALDCANLVEKRLGFAFFGGFTDVRQDIFSTDFIYFNDSLTMDFDTVIGSCNRGVNKQFKKEEKEKKKQEKVRQ